MSVSVIPGGCLRHRYSSTYLRISLLHVEFYPPLTHSSRAVSNAIPRLSPGISHLTYTTACARFTTRRPSSLTRHCWIRVAPIVQNSPLLPPVGVWAVSQSQCGWSSSQTSY